MKLTEAPEEVSAQRSAYGVAILLELNQSGRHIYEGTVPPHIKARRRAKRKVARASRKANR